MLDFYLSESREDELLKEIQMEYLESAYFFEKYLIVGSSLESLQENVNADEKPYNQKRLTPGILL